MTAIHGVLHGTAGRTSRGYLGWSAVTAIEVSGRRILFDVGGVGDRPGLLAGLGGLGWGVDDIYAVVLSHLHFDHAASTELFPRARILVHRDEIDYARGDGRADPAMPSYLTDSVIAEPNLDVVTGESVGLADGAELRLTPGHTGGSISLLVRTAEGTTAIVGDTIKNRRDLVAGVVTGAVDDVASRRSIGALLDVADVVVPGHDVRLSVTGEPLETASWPAEQGVF